MFVVAAIVYDNFAFCPGFVKCFLCVFYFGNHFAVGESFMLNFNCIFALLCVSLFSCF